MCKTYASRRRLYGAWPTSNELRSERTIMNISGDSCSRNMYGLCRPQSQTHTPAFSLHTRLFTNPTFQGWLGSRVVSVLDLGAVGPGFKSKPRRCRVTVLGKLFTSTVPLFTKQQNCPLKVGGDNCRPGGK